jgi:hypothetical protein
VGVRVGDASDLRRVRVSTTYLRYLTCQEAGEHNETWLWRYGWPLQVPSRARGAVQVQGQRHWPGGWVTKIAPAVAVVDTVGPCCSSEATAVPSPIHPSVEQGAN